MLPSVDMYRPRSNSPSCDQKPSTWYPRWLHTVSAPLRKRPNITRAHPRAGKGKIQRGIKPHHAETLIPPALAEERSSKIPARGGRNTAYKTECQRRPFRARKPAARETVFPVEREAETHKDKHDRRHGKADRFRFRYIKKTVVDGKRQQREHQEEIPAAEPCFNGWFYFCFHRFAASFFRMIP